MPRHRAVNHEEQEADYDALTDTEHVLKTPGMYIDSITKSKRKEWALIDDDDGLYCTQIETMMPIGLERIFDEIMANACDATNKTRQKGRRTGDITVTMNSDTISVCNISDPIPVIVHSKFNEWIPELIFTRMKSGSNFGDNRTGAGRNGMGGTVCAIFSSSFTVEVLDAVNGQKFSHTWVNNLNLEESGEPEVEDYDGKISSVTVTYTADLPRFGYKNMCYPPEAEDIMRRICADSALSSKIPIVFNDLRLKFPSIVEYGRLYSNDITDPLLYYKWPEGACVFTDSDGVQTSRNAIPDLECLMFSFPRQGFQIGMCNGILNADGGEHVNAALNAISQEILESGKNTGLEGKDVLSSIRSRVKDHVFLVISVHGKNPVWNSQSKTIFRGFEVKKNKISKPEIELTDKAKAVIASWRAFSMVNDSLRSELINKITKRSAASKRMTKHDFKGEDAGWVDTNKADQTTLAGCEGKSAEGCLRCLISADPQGYDKFGIFTFGGKIPNAIKFSDPYMIKHNAVFKELADQQGLDNLDYTIEKNLATLRHRYFMIVPDADIDGLHITVLVLGFFEFYFPSFIKAGLVKFWRTKIKVASRKGYSDVTFYTDYEFDMWSEKQGDELSKWTIFHYKGLGSSSKEDAMRDFKNAYILDFVRDKLASETLNVVLRNVRGDTDIRKEWILAYDPRAERERIRRNQYKITNFINDEVRGYSKHTLVRHLVARDGFRETSRKIMNTLIKHWQWFSLAKPDKKMRVITLTSKIMEDNDYHHGDLSTSLMSMGCDFPGSNGVPIVVADGQYGTIFEGGKDRAAPRYPFAYPNPIYKYIILKEDEDILEWNYEEGKKVEPKRYYPIVPITVINGVKSIATGWSSFIYTVSPIALIDWEIEYLRGVPFDELPQLDPWVRGHKGLNYIVESKVKPKKAKPSNKPKTMLDDNGDECEILYDYSSSSESFEDFDEEHEKGPIEMAKSRYHLRSEGCFEIAKNGDIIITELPVGKWIKPYCKGSEQAIKNEKKRETRAKDIRARNEEDGPLKGDKKVWCLRNAIAEGLIRDFKQESTVNNVRIVIKGPNFDPEDAMEQLKLYKNTGLGNMILLDDDDKPFKCESVKHIVKDFMEWRLPYYQLRKDKQLQRIQEKIEHHQKRRAYIEAVLAEELVIFKPRQQVNRKQVLDNIERLGLDPGLYGKIKDDEFNQESCDALSAKIHQLELEYSRLENTDNSEMMIADLERFKTHYIEKYGYDE